MAIRRNPAPPDSPLARRVHAHERASRPAHGSLSADQRHALLDLIETLAPVEAWFEQQYGVEFPADLASVRYPREWSIAHDRARAHQVSLVRAGDTEPDMDHYVLLGAESGAADASAWLAGTIAGVMDNAAHGLPTADEVKAVRHTLEAFERASSHLAKMQASHTRRRIKIAQGVR
jgi:hypothetical protein